MFSSAVQQGESSSVVYDVLKRTRHVIACWSLAAGTEVHWVRPTATSGICAELSRHRTVIISEVRSHQISDDATIPSKYRDIDTLLPIHTIS